MYELNLSSDRYIVTMFASDLDRNLVSGTDANNSLVLDMEDC